MEIKIEKEKAIEIRDLKELLSWAAWAKLSDQKKGIDDDCEKPTEINSTFWED